MIAPSPRQLVLLRFIAAYRDDHGRAPSLSEMGRHMGTRWVKAIIDHLVAMEKKGLVARVFGEARSVRITEAGYEALLDATPLGQHRLAIRKLQAVINGGPSEQGRGSQAGSQTPRPEILHRANEASG